MVSAPARSPLPITAIARAHTRLELNFSSVFVHSASVYLCALVYLCNARHRISRRWRAIPAACNLTLPRPRSATIFYNLPHSQPLASLVAEKMISLQQNRLDVKRGNWQQRIFQAGQFGVVWVYYRFPITNIVLHDKEISSWPDEQVILYYVFWQSCCLFI